MAASEGEGRRLSDFDYELPEELIAQEPPAERDAARMLVVHKAERRWEDARFRDLPRYLKTGDCLALNNSRVIPSRLYGRREGHSGRVEVLLLEPAGSGARDWRALVRPGRRLGVGEEIRFGDQLSARVTGRGERGERVVTFLGEEDVYEALDRLGHMPLPPYIRREEAPSDRERYQTVYARQRGSAAAPTAGLHFTGEILDRCRAAGAAIAQVTLHVGLGTFQPIEREDYARHELHYESYSIGEEDWREIESAKRVIAVGTTSVRSIEAASAGGNREGRTRLFIHPGYEFRTVQGMLTNFHLPRTSLLLLVCALAGEELTMAAYRHAIQNRYRFFSYGDCMLIT